MILDASALTAFQACKRRYLLSHDYLPPRWHPKRLFDRCLRHAVAALSSTSPPSPADAAHSARAEFYSAAARPGLDLPGDEVYAAAKEWGALLDTIIRSIARLSLLTLRSVPDATLDVGLDLRWRSLALGQDDAGMLHRWVTVERWDDQAAAREMHGWAVMGDIAVAYAPLQLHVVVLGPMRDGHHHVAWGRRFLQPGIRGLKGHWRTPNGKPLGRDWKPQFLADLTGPDASPDAWVEGMWKEGAAAGLLHHPIIECPSAETLEDVRRQIVMEAEAMRRAEGSRWSEWPMSRGACDWIRGQCAFAPCCHREASQEVVDVGRLGYLRRPKPDSDPPRPQPLPRPDTSAEPPLSAPTAPQLALDAAHP